MTRTSRTPTWAHVALVVFMWALLPCQAGPLAGGAAHDDPFSGPWYGHGYLQASAAGANALPAGAGGEGVQQWLFVGDWRVLGPAPVGEWTAAAPALPTTLPSAQVVAPPPVKPAGPVAAPPDPDDAPALPPMPAPPRAASSGPHGSRWG
jgi:hypothetical protein